MAASSASSRSAPRIVVEVNSCSPRRTNTLDPSERRNSAGTGPPTSANAKLTDSPSASTAAANAFTDVSSTLSPASRKTAAASRATSRRFQVAPRSSSRATTMSAHTSGCVLSTGSGSPTPTAARDQRPPHLVGSDSEHLRGLCQPHLALGRPNSSGCSRGGP